MSPDHHRPISRTGRCGRRERSESGSDHRALPSGDRVGRDSHGIRRWITPQKETAGTRRRLDHGPEALEPSPPSSSTIPSNWKSAQKPYLPCHIPRLLQGVRGGFHFQEVPCKDRCPHAVIVCAFTGGRLRNSPTGKYLREAATPIWGVIYLTHDDMMEEPTLFGGLYNTKMLVSLLQSHGIPDTFFLVGCHIYEQPVSMAGSSLCQQGLGDVPVAVIQEVADAGFLTLPITCFSVWP